MKPVNQRIKFLINLLKGAYQNRPIHPPSEQWQLEVMQRIHSLSIPSVAGSFSNRLEVVTWKMSPVTLAMVLVCAVLWMNLEIIPDSQVFQLISSNMEDINLLELLL